MSETIKDIIDRLRNGDNVNAEKAFNTAMAGKMNDALDAKKVELASSMVQRKVEEPVEEVPMEKSDATVKDTDESSSTPVNIVDQFRNNSPSIADRAQNKTDDSTSHLLKRGGYLRLNSLIDLNRRFLIINDVFGGKRINFDKEIECIDKLSDLDSAMSYLNDHVVKTYNVNTATKGFEILNKVVVRRFTS